MSCYYRKNNLLEQVHYFKTVICLVSTIVRATLIERFQQCSGIFELKLIFLVDFHPKNYQCHLLPCTKLVYNTAFSLEDYSLFIILIFPCSHIISSYFGWQFVNMTQNTFTI